MKVLKINTSKEYSVYISNNLDAFSDKLNNSIKGSNVCILTDSNVKKLYLERIKNIFTKKRVFSYSIKSGEKSKNIKNYSAIMNFLCENNFNREDAIVTLGGGVITDIGGFVASTYMRGISLFSLPTTLLAMVDSSVGGKTAINLNKGKNLCGTFYQPDGVFIDISFLKTLSKREINCGLGEVIKYKYLDSENKINLTNISERLIYNCLKIKKQIVEEDERESGKRKLLNFGHTFGHSIERIEKFNLSHGECVIRGILYALILSKNYYGLDNSVVISYLSLLEKLNINIKTDYSERELIKNIAYDKKRNNDYIDFVLLDKNNKLKIERIEISKIEKYLAR